MLIDWKRTLGLPGKFTSVQSMRPPVAHIADCTGMHYRLQLNVYRHLLEKYYDLRVSRMLVVCCHPEHYPAAFVDDVPRMERETKDILDARARECADGQVPGGSFDGNRDEVGGAHLIQTTPSAKACLDEYDEYDEPSVLGAASTMLYRIRQPSHTSSEQSIVSGINESHQRVKLQDLLGGASQASGFFPQVGEEVSQDADNQLEARVVARDDTFQMKDEFEEELQCHLEGALDMETGARDIRLEQARKRRFLPGAETTMSNFRDLFSNLYEAADGCLAEVPRLVGEDEPSIPCKVSRIREMILQSFPRMEESLLRLVTGAITVYRLRLSDLHLRELVMLLWIIEGEQFMRCHDGNLYFFHLGAFALHKGVPPQGTLARCKRFFLQLEGLFRLMGNAKLTSDNDVLSVVQDLLQTMNNSAKHLLNECEDAAFGHIPRPAGASRGRARRGEEPDEEAPNAVATSDGRCQGLADALTKAGYSMQNELLRDKIFNLVVEWCDSPRTRSAGISYQDCAFLYDQLPGQNVTSARGLPEENIYVHIPHPLLGYNSDDPVLLRAQQSLMRFYSETFWLNNDVSPLLPAVLV